MPPHSVPSGSLSTGEGGGEALLVESNLHLAHKGVVTLLDELTSCCVCALIYILHLETASLEVPPLEAEDSLMLIHIEGFVEIEIVV